MKYMKLTTLIFGLLLFGCNQADTKTPLVREGKISISANDKEQIQNLIRQVLNWVDTTKTIDLLPIVADSKDSIYIGFDLEKHKQNLDNLRQTNFFATEFIENYNQIILTLDKGLRSGNYDRWLVGDLQTFIFANDIDPWTLCQDMPYDKPNPFDFIEVNISNEDKGEAEWKWGRLEQNTDPTWKDFSYLFRVIKENDKWKISYLQGFDFQESTRKDGQL
jgi:hypothetical protein